jgi:hypothetical protein
MAYCASRIGPFRERERQTILPTEKGEQCGYEHASSGVSEGQGKSFTTIKMLAFNHRQSR